MQPGEPFELISRNFWALCLVISGFQILRARRRAFSVHWESNAKAHAALAYLRWYMVALVLPWVVMGCGVISGSTPTVWYYFRPQDGNPYVLAWIGVIILISFLYSAWIFLANGARKIVDLKLMQIIGGKDGALSSASRIKFFAALGPPFTVLWVFMATAMNVPLPK